MYGGAAGGGDTAPVFGHVSAFPASRADVLYASMGLSSALMVSTVDRVPPTMPLQKAVADLVYVAGSAGEGLMP